MSSHLVRGGTIVTMNDRFEVLSGGSSIRGRIARAAPTMSEPLDRMVELLSGGTTSSWPWRPCTVERDRPHLVPGDEPYSTIVYAAHASDIRATIVDGDLLVDRGERVRLDAAEAAAERRRAAADLLSHL